MRAGSGVAWWRKQPGTVPNAAESVAANVKYECVPSLGSPGISSCEKVSFEMFGSEEIVLDRASKLFIKFVGMYIWSELAFLHAYLLEIAYSWCVYVIWGIVLSP